LPSSSPKTAAKRPRFDADPATLRRIVELKRQIAKAKAEAAERDANAWRRVARPEQLAPDGDWLTWAFIAGRGAGKTRSAAEWVNEQAKNYPGCRIALVGRTPADVRDVMIEGESGILACARSGRPVYESTKRRLTWPNGTTAHAYSAEVPAALRGPQHHFAWADENAAWKDARKGDVLDTSWNNLMLGLRLGSAPRVVVTTTPKPNALMRTILGRHTTVRTSGSTYDNLANLAPSFREHVLATYEGTRIGRQELLGELLEDVEGALWTLAGIDADRVSPDAVPDMVRIVVAVDPSGGDGPNNDEQGIVVAGLGIDGELYVLDDRSCKLSPHGWASRAIGAFREYAADRIIAEINFGAQMVEHTVRSVDKSVPVKTINASRGKVQRAEPIAALYEQHRVHHVGPMAKLEDQMTTWTPIDGTSPDRLDALVWAITELTGGAGQGAAFLAAMKNRAEAEGLTVSTAARDWRSRVPKKAGG
jgi:phage terminase large subunit-like protein